MVLAYSHDMIAGSDGTVTGGRGQHRPVVITKNIDKSSPLISNALQDGEEIKCVIDFTAHRRRAVRKNIILFV